MPLSFLQPRLRIYFENAVGKLLEHPDGYAVVQYKPGKRKYDELLAFLTHVGTLLQARGWYKILGDQRDMTAFTEEERQWITDNWLKNAGSRSRPVYAAVLLAHDVFARLSMNLVMTEAKETAMTYRLFEEGDAAVQWLQQVK